MATKNKRKPSYWCKIFGVRIIDPDGWRGSKSFETPITKTEFKKRMAKSTIGYRVPKGVI